MHYNNILRFTQYRRLAQLVRANSLQELGQQFKSVNVYTGYSLVGRILVLGMSGRWFKSNYPDIDM